MNNRELFYEQQNAVMDYLSDNVKDILAMQPPKKGKTIFPSVEEALEKLKNMSLDYDDSSHYEDYQPKTPSR